MAQIMPPQPGLKPFVVFNHVPPGCTPHIVTDTSVLPLLRPGEIVLIDTADRTPADRELFVIEWGRDSSRGPERHIVELWSRNVCLRNGGQANEERGDVWFAGAYHRPRSAAEGMEWLKSGGARVRHMMIDGPYAATGEKAWYLPSLLIGRVVGILEPSYAEPALVAARGEG